MPAVAEAFASRRQLTCRGRRCPRPRAGAIVRNEDLSDSRVVIADAQGKLHLVVPFTDALPDGLRQRLRGD